VNKNLKKLLGGINDHLDGNKIREGFLVDLMMSPKSTHKSCQAEAVSQNITKIQIKNMENPLPPVEIQDQYFSKMNSIFLLRKKSMHANKTLLDLHESLSQKTLFRRTDLMTLSFMHWRRIQNNLKFVFALIISVIPYFERPKLCI
jgi:hypothetical protein